MGKVYKTGAEISRRIVYPDSLGAYLGKNITVVFANPEDKPRAIARLTRRKERYFAGNRPLAPGDGLYNENMQFIGRVERRT